MAPLRGACFFRKCGCGPCVAQNFKRNGTAAQRYGQRTALGSQCAETAPYRPDSQWRRAQDALILQRSLKAEEMAKIAHSPLRGAIFMPPRCEKIDELRKVSVSKCTSPVDVAECGMRIKGLRCLILVDVAFVCCNTMYKFRSRLCVVHFLWCTSRTNLSPAAAQCVRCYQSV